MEVGFLGGTAGGEYRNKILSINISGMATQSLPILCMKETEESGSR